MSVVSPKGEVPNEEIADVHARAGSIHLDYSYGLWPKPARKRSKKEEREEKAEEEEHEAVAFRRPELKNDRRALELAPLRVRHRHEDAGDAHTMTFASPFGDGLGDVPFNRLSSLFCLSSII